MGRPVCCAKITIHIRPTCIFVFPLLSSFFSFSNILVKSLLVFSYFRLIQLVFMTTNKLFVAAVMSHAPFMGHCRWPHQHILAVLALPLTAENGRIEYVLAHRSLFRHGAISAPVMRVDMCRSGAIRITIRITVTVIRIFGLCEWRHLAKEPQSHGQLAF